MGSCRSGVLLAVLCVLAGSTMACGSSADEGMPLLLPSTTVATSSVTPPPTPVPTGSRDPVAEDAATCTSPRGVPWSRTNPPYAGPGPHYMTTVVPVKYLHDDLAADIDVLPAEMWGGPDGVAGYQLIACVLPAGTKRQAGTLTCHFTVGTPTFKTFPLYEGDYRVTVHEARTGRMIATLTVPGTKASRDSCPSFVVDTGHTVVLRGLDGKVLGRALRPLFSNPAPG